MFASTEALVGVHSASYGGRDTPDAQAATVRMARRLSVYGVPDAILGKLVSAQTQPDLVVGAAATSKACAWT